MGGRAPSQRQLTDARLLEGIREIHRERWSPHAPSRHSRAADRVRAQSPKWRSCSNALQTRARAPTNAYTVTRTPSPPDVSQFVGGRATSTGDSMSRLPRLEADRAERWRRLVRRSRELLVHESRRQALATLKRPHLLLAAYTAKECTADAAPPDMTCGTNSRLPCWCASRLLPGSCPVRPIIGLPPRSQLPGPRP